MAKYLYQHQATQADYLQQPMHRVYHHVVNF